MYELESGDIKKIKVDHQSSEVRVLVFNLFERLSVYYFLELRIISFTLFLTFLNIRREGYSKLYSYDQHPVYIYKKQPSRIDLKHKLL